MKRPNYIHVFVEKKTTSPFLSRTISWNAVFHVSSLLDGRRQSDGSSERKTAGVAGCVSEKRIRSVVCKRETDGLREIVGLERHVCVCVRKKGGKIMKKNTSAVRPA